MEQELRENLLVLSQKKKTCEGRNARLTMTEIFTFIPWIRTEGKDFLF